MDDIFDFGFTAVDEAELEAVQQAAAVATTASSSNEQLQAKIDKLILLSRVNKATLNTASELN